MFSWSSYNPQRHLSVFQLCESFEELNQHTSSSPPSYESRDKRLQTLISSVNGLYRGIVVVHEVWRLKNSIRLVWNDSDQSLVC